MAAQLTLLHIEDDPAIARLMSAILRFQGYRVITARSGAEALHWVDGEHERPDLIVTDYQLPLEETGDVVVEAITALLGARPPTILLTGDISDELRERASKVVDRVLLKPVEIELLLRELASLSVARAV
jgi:CheY-like chemotaxis protein